VNRRASRRAALALVGALAATAALAVAAPAVLAHESREVAGYTLEVGFLDEPVFVGQRSGLDLVVRRGDQPVAGLEKTLKAEVGYGGRTIPLEVEAREEAGAYEGVFIPTAAGQYTFHLSGTIDGHAVDERFQSGPTTFDDVRDAAGGQFPVQLPSTVDLAGQARAGADAARLVPVAIALGAGGLLLGLIALGIALASRSRRVAE
jgi:hypothetical protein